MSNTMAHHQHQIHNPKAEACTSIEPSASMSTPPAIVVSTQSCTQVMDNLNQAQRKTLYQHHTHTLVHNSAEACVHDRLRLRAEQVALALNLPEISPVLTERSTPEDAYLVTPVLGALELETDQPNAQDGEARASSRGSTQASSQSTAKDASPTDSFGKDYTLYDDADAPSASCIKAEAVVHGSASTAPQLALSPSFDAFYQRPQQAGQPLDTAAHAKAFYADHATLLLSPGALSQQGDSGGNQAQYQQYVREAADRRAMPPPPLVHASSSASSCCQMSHSDGETHFSSVHVEAHHGSSQAVLTSTSPAGLVSSVFTDPHGTALTQTLSLPALTSDVATPAASSPQGTLTTSQDEQGLFYEIPTLEGVFSPSTLLAYERSARSLSNSARAREDRAQEYHLLSAAHHTLATLPSSLPGAASTSVSTDALLSAATRERMPVQLGMSDPPFQNGSDLSDRLLRQALQQHGHALLSGERSTIHPTRVDLMHPQMDAPQGASTQQNAAAASGSGSGAGTSAARGRKRKSSSGTARRGRKQAAEGDADYNNEQDAEADKDEADDDDNGEDDDAQEDQGKKGGSRRKSNTTPSDPDDITRKFLRAKNTEAAARSRKKKRDMLAQAQKRVGELEIENAQLRQILVMKDQELTELKGRPARHASPIH